MSEDGASGYCTLVEDSIAGVAYYGAGQVIDELSVDEDLMLRREPENRHDALAVAIHTSDDVKLGYVPRRCNAGIARRLDAGMPLLCRVRMVQRDGTGFGIAFRIVSTDPEDIPDPPQRCAAPHSEQPRRWLSSASASRRCIDQARRWLALGDRLQAYRELETALNWAIEARGLRQSESYRAISWNDQFARFVQDSSRPQQQRILRWSMAMRALVEVDPDEIVARDVGDEELSGTASDAIKEMLRELRTGISRFCADPAGGADIPARLARLDQAFVSETAELTAILRGEGANVAVDTGHLPTSRREEALRFLFRWTRLLDDAERGEAVPVSRLDAARTLNWDAALLRELQLEELRQAVDAIPRTDREKAKRADFRRKYPDLFPQPLLPDEDKQVLLQQAIDLLQRAHPPTPALLALAERLHALQPQTRRRKRRRFRAFTDTDLYLAEAFLRSAASPRPDAGRTFRLLVVCVPYRRLDRLRVHALSALGDRLARRYFGVSLDYLRNTFPPPALAGRCSDRAGFWLAHFHGQPAPWDIAPAALCEQWKTATAWIAAGTPGSAVRRNDIYRLALARRVLLRDRLLLSRRSRALGLKNHLAAADVEFLLHTTPVGHVLGLDWEEAHGHLPATHWWYYRWPVALPRRERTMH